MASFNRKGRIILSLFLVHFLVYAVSPLSNIAQFQHTSERGYVEKEKAVSLKNIHIFFVEIFLSNFNEQENTDDSTSRLVLLKKTKAIIQSLADSKFKLAQIAENIEDQPALGPVPSAIRDVPGSSPKPYDSFLAVFSGLSPPCV